MEVYRRGHNGPDSKSGIRQRIVGSNPTASATKNEHRLMLFFCAFALDKNPLGSALASAEGLPLGNGCIPPFFNCFYLFVFMRWDENPLGSALASALSSPYFKTPFNLIVKFLNIC